MSNRDAAYKVVRRLRKEGYQALFAGGCVRDRLLGCCAHDYDVVTDAVPEQVTKCFRRTLQIGAQFGVVMVLIGGDQVEVATFRTEGGYQDGRHPGHVEFASAVEDASRRDFTVNGMFFDPIEKKVLDFVKGQQDLEKGILRTIGNPDERFSEDYLRMLRAVRFAVKLDFKIEPATWASIQKHAAKITGISAERIAAELERILTHPNRGAGIHLLIESGLAKSIFKNRGSLTLSALTSRHPSTWVHSRIRDTETKSGLEPSKSPAVDQDAKPKLAIKKAITAILFMTTSIMLWSTRIEIRYVYSDFEMEILVIYEF